MDNLTDMKKTVNVGSFIVSTAYFALDELKNNNGFMSAGHNGLYFDPETPVRNTAHWLIVFAKAFEATNDVRFLNAVELCSEFLMSEINTPNGYTFHCRNKKGKDSCNGLIGQAWVIEALHKSYELLKDVRYINRAIACFNMHPQQEDTALWERIEITGDNLGLDFTFNHQLWFCMAGVLIMEHSGDVSKKVYSFLENFNCNIVLRGNGRIGHQVYLGYYRSYIKPVIRSLIRKGWKLDNLEKEIGYHAFNTYALSVIKSKIPEYSLWKDIKVIRLIDYLSSSEYVNNIGTSKYGFPYNPPGIEAAYTFQEFCDISNSMSKNDIDKLLIKQFSEGFNFSVNMLNENGTKDKLTHAARIYEATRLSEMFVGLNFEN